MNAGDTQTDCTCMYVRVSLSLSLSICVSVGAEKQIATLRRTQSQSHHYSRLRPA
jgi:hypothetical protein